MHKRMQLSNTILLFVVVSLLSASVLSGSAKDADLQSISEILDHSCEAHCLNRVKNTDGCVIFCGFMDHVKKHDLEEIYSLYEKGNKNSQPLVCSVGWLVGCLVHSCSMVEGMGNG